MNLTTQQFWDEMCKIGFVRTGRLTGQNGDQLFTTNMPPEEVEGFIEFCIVGISKNLDLARPPSMLALFLLHTGHWIVLGAMYAVFVAWLWS